MEIGIRCPYLNWLKHFCLWMFQQVRFASFFSRGFITAIVVNPPEKKLSKRTSVHCTVVRTVNDVLRNLYPFGRNLYLLSFCAIKRYRFNDYVPTPISRTPKSGLSLARIGSHIKIFFQPFNLLSYPLKYCKQFKMICM